MDQTSYPRIFVERTLALIKPDAIHKAEEIEDIILKSGFIILQVGSNVPENTAVTVGVLNMNINNVRYLGCVAACQEEFDPINYFWGNSWCNYLLS